MDPYIELVNAFFSDAFRNIFKSSQHMLVEGNPIDKGDYHLGWQGNLGQDGCPLDKAWMPFSAITS